MNYRLYFNMMLVGGLVLFFSSCAREKATLSYNSEKLRKQSLEIENSQPSKESLAVTKVDKNGVTSNVSEDLKPVEKTTIESSTISANESKAGKKVSPMQKLIAKKIAKKLNANKTAALEKNLKFAIIFGIVGLIFMLFGYPIWIIGAILLVVGLIFLLLWVLEQ